MALGDDQRLFILAFDHRGSPHRDLLRLDAGPGPDGLDRIREAKSVVFDGFVRAVAAGAPTTAVGILVDEQYGAEPARQARANGWILAMPVERSGATPLAFEHGDDFPASIEAFDPMFVKVLVRYNPQGDRSDNETSLTRLRRLSEWVRGTDRRLLCELIVPAEPDQLVLVGGDEGRYEAELRPALMRQGMAELQDAGVEPHVWKIEGIDRRADCELTAKQARSGGRDQVGCVVLGRGAGTEKVERWLRACAGVDGYIGFAIGRTIWADQLRHYLDGALSRDDAAEQISANYRQAIDVYTGAAS